MQLNPYLFFNGDCEQALRFYEKHLGGKIEALMRYGEAPEGTPIESTKDKIMHARIRIGDSLVMASDAHANYSKPQGFFLSIPVETPEEAERVYRPLSDGGSVILALDKTFFARKFAMLVDRFGTPWMINCE